MRSRKYSAPAGSYGHPLKPAPKWAIAASVLAHIGVLAVVMTQRHTLPIPAQDVAGPPIAIVPVLLAPRTKPSAASHVSPPAPVRLHRRQQRPGDNGTPSVTPLVSTPTPAFGPQANALAAQGQVTAPVPTAQDLTAALRHGVAGCANLNAVGMTRADRERCNDQLAHGVASAPFMPAALEPRMRTYYDAVALAKQRDPPHVPVTNKATIPGDPPPHRPGGDHHLGIGCSIPFGPGQKPKKLPHALYLGPCFIEPPKGPLDPEVDITPP